MVGVVGFELTTLCSQSRCANQAALHPDNLERVGRVELRDLQLGRLLDAPCPVYPQNDLAHRRGFDPLSLV